MSTTTTIGQRFIAASAGAKRYSSPSLSAATGTTYPAGAYVGDFTGNSQGYFLQVSQYDYVERTRVARDEFGNRVSEIYYSYERVTFWVHRSEVELEATATPSPAPNPTPTPAPTPSPATTPTPSPTPSPNPTPTPNPSPTSAAGGNKELDALQKEIERLRTQQTELLKKPAADFDPVLMNTLSQKLGQLQGEAHALTQKPDWMNWLYAALAVVGVVIVITVLVWPGKK